ncbi:hypothetical protein CA85_11030 [Allorhodopirellula solitaria]|uniref:Uncharacterized protein n=1 Tax=Allorhodopirellula solitaria TaxID=2527987 RepID=A0A5C5YEN1_9BACT|nr:hypothetical protein CA85_11030 [Allorhodopirellula solitaria]
MARSRATRLRTLPRPSGSWIRTTTANSTGASCDRISPVAPDHPAVRGTRAGIPVADGTVMATATDAAEMPAGVMLAVTILVDEMASAGVIAAEIRLTETLIIAVLAVAAHPSRLINAMMPADAVDVMPMVTLAMVAMPSEVQRAERTMQSKGFHGRKIKPNRQTNRVIRNRASPPLDHAKGLRSWSVC